MNSKRVLYMGDTSLSTAAGYLAGVMTHFNIEYDYLDSNSPITKKHFENEYSLYIISDYPSSNFTDDTFFALEDKIKHGSGILMIGGWESFFGKNGEYHQTILAEILPIVMQDSDDRTNCPYPCLVWKESDHKITDNLPFETPPGIGGYNKLHMKAGGQMLLSAVQFQTKINESGCSFTEKSVDPLLVVGEHGRGRTASFATDVAPHWVGGFVDWGQNRVKAKGNEFEIEVGSDYAAFFRNLLNWTGRLDS